MDNNQTTQEAPATTTAEPSVTTTTDSTLDTTTTADKTDSVDVTLVTEDDDTLTTGFLTNATITKPVVINKTQYVDEDGNNAFSAENSTFTITSGDTFTVSDVTAKIVLENNSITNSDPTSVLLRASGSAVTLNFSNQIAEGDIILDGLSSLSLFLDDYSFYMGAINGGNTSQSVSLSIDENSQFILAGDTYISALTNAKTDNMNIYSNGYKLYVAGTEVAVNGSEAPAVPEVVIEEPEPAEEEEVTPEIAPAPKPATDYTPFIVGGAAVLVIILAVIAFIIHNKKKNAATPPTGMTGGAPGAFDGGRPDFSAFDDGPDRKSVV